MVSALIWTDLDGDDPGFDLSADLEEAGIAATDGLPGVRNLSGSIRADRAGGRVEIESAGLSLDLGPHLAAPIGFDSAVGTVIWRRNQEGMIVLSDSVRIRNADLDSQMNLQVSLPGGGAAPFIDFESTWSVSDLSAMYKYLPVQLMQPKLRQWLTDAMVAGRIPRGTTQLIGSLTSFRSMRGMACSGSRHASRTRRSSIHRNGLRHDSITWT